jgi:hypothetical protein
MTKNEAGTIVSLHGIQAGPFYIPPFTAYPGQIVLVHFPNHPDFLSASQQLARTIISMTETQPGKSSDPFRRVDTPMDMESDWRNRFYRTTVQRYIRRTGNPENDPMPRALHLTGVTSRTSVNQIPATYRKIIALCSALSWTNNIIFDLAGVGPEGGITAFQLAKEAIGTNGIAILTDTYDEFKDQCSQYIAVELNDHTKTISASR